MSGTDDLDWLWLSSFIENPELVRDHLEETANTKDDGSSSKNILLSLVSVHAQLGNTPEAKRSLTQLIDQLPENEAGSSEVLLAESLVLASSEEPELKLQKLLLAFSQVHEQESLLGAKITSEVGYFYANTHQFEKAKKPFLDAIDLYTSNGRPSDAADIWITLLGHYLKVRDYGAYLSSIEPLSELVDSLNNVRLKSRLVGLNAKYYFVTEDQTKALTHYGKALELAPEWDKHHILALTYEKGMIQFQLGNYTEATSTLKSASSLAETLKDNIILSHSQNGIGTIYLYQGRNEEALSIFMKNLDRAKKMNDWQTEFNSLNNISLIFSNMNEHHKAIEFLQQSYELAIQRDLLPGKILSLNNLGRQHNTLGEHKKAKAYYQQALDLDPTSKIRSYKIDSLSGMADSLGFEENYKQAMTLLLEAEELLKGTKDSFTQSNLYIDIGNLYVRMSRPEKAEAYLLKAYTILTEEKDKFSLKRLLSGIIDLYEKENRWENAFTYQQKLLELNEESYETSRSDAIAEMAQKYESEKKAREIELLSKENALQEIQLARQKAERNLFYALGIGFSLVTILLVARYFKHRENIDIKLFSLAFKTTSEGMWITDANSKVVAVNNAYEKITGREATSVIGNKIKLPTTDQQEETLTTKIKNVVNAEGRWTGELIDRRPDGTCYPIEITVEPIRSQGGRLTHYLGVFKDITERKQNEAELRRLATHDDLLDIPNRTLFNEILDNACINGEKNAFKPAILFIDLDNFKSINDSYGHELGDELLKTVTSRFLGRLSKEEMLSRIGGDEFCVFIENKEPADEAAHVAKALIDALEQPLQVGQRELKVTTSIGIAVFPTDGETAIELSRNADIAMYEAKSSGKNTFRFYEPGLNERIVADLEMEEKIKFASEREVYQLHYQPRVDLSTGEVNGAEALIRWFEPNGNTIFPDQFIPLAERTGLITGIDRIVLKLACSHIRQWLDKGIDPGKISINLSAIQFSRPEILLPLLEKMIQIYKIPPKHLELEITEGMLMGDVNGAIKTMKQLRESGFTLAVDDFGTGYSSLSYIQSFPINTLKVDRAFISNLHLSKRDQSVTRAIIDMAHNLGLSVVAEGVELGEHLSILRALGCEEYQGYHFSRPVPVVDIEKFFT